MASHPMVKKAVHKVLADHGGRLHALPAVSPLSPRTALTCMLGAVTMFYMSLRAFGKNRVYIGTGADLHRVFDNMPTAQRPPRPPIWAYGSHIQFIPWIIYNVLSSAFVPLRFQMQRFRVFGLLDKTKPESATNPRSMDDDVVISCFKPTSSCSMGPNSFSIGFNMSQFV